MEVSGKKMDRNHMYMCNPCKEDDDNTHADMYCFECEVYLCRTCYKSHKGLKATKSHTVVKIDDMPQRQLTEGHYCSKHNDRVLEYYCEEHEALCCSECVLSSHTTCLVANLNTTAKQNMDSSAYVDLHKKLNDIRDKAKEAKENAERKSRQQHDVFMKLEQDIKDFRREINKYLDMLQEELLKQKDSLQEKENGSFQTSLSVTDTMISELDKISSIIADQEKYKLYLHLEISSRKMQSQIKAFEKQLEEFNDFNDSLSFEFLPNRELQKYVRTASCLGRIKDAEKILDQGQRKHQDNTTKVKIPEHGRRTNQNNHGISEATGMTRQVATQGKERETSSTVASKLPIFYLEEELSESPGSLIGLQFLSWIYVVDEGAASSVMVKRCVMLDEHNLVILEGSLGFIKIFNLDDEKIKYEYDSTDTQTDITYMHPDTIVAATGRRLIYLNKQLTYKKEVLLRGKCYAVIYSRELSMLFVIVKINSWQIKLLNKEGSIVKTLTVSADMFKEPDYMTVSKDGGNIIISDGKLNTVTSINMEGNVNFISTSRNYRGAAGITVDQQDDIYTLYEYEYSNVLLIISSKGQQKKKIYLKETYEPYSLAWNADCTRLYVGCYGGMVVYKVTTDQWQSHHNAF